MHPMLWHDLRLALLSLRRTPFVAALVVAVIAIGIGSSVVAITLYHAKAGNPIWWKNDVLYRVMLDSRPIGHEFEEGRHGELPPYLMIYRDAEAIYRSKIPTRSVKLLVSSGRIAAARPGAHPLNRSVRFTTSEFFSMFDVPYLYGHGWSKSDDDGPAQVAVISRYLNDTLFAGENSVGRSIDFGGRQFRIVGVIDAWLPVPRFYDVGQSFLPPDALFVPFHWAESLPELEFVSNCQQTQVVLTSFKEIMAAECISTGLWVELDGLRQRQAFRQFLDNYSRAQIEAGRFVRPVNDRLLNVADWLRINDVLDNQSRFQLVLALIFLGICILNALGLLLAKFMSVAPLCGIRRALGATRDDIMRQHLMEVMILGAVGGGCGIAIAALGLRLIRVFIYAPPAKLDSNPDYATIAQSLSHMDGKMIALAVCLSLLAGLLAGIYPVWRIGRMAPATFLKSQ
jgi:putative ABC transport system permease protein